MPDIAALVQSGTGTAWLLPLAVVLGGLHALEPGHSKSMMTAFIVAIHGTAAQAILLALSVTIGHTIVIWVLAIMAWQLQDTALLERAEPWLLVAGGLVVVVLALRILSRLGLPAKTHQHARQGHLHGHNHHHDHGMHDGHAHGNVDQDAAHAADVKQRLAKGPVTNLDVVWFGLGGGLMPCPAAFAVLLACFHQKAYVVGIVVVAAFSIGLASMLVAIGLLAAWGARALASHQPGLDRFAGLAPYASASLVLVIGLLIIVQGLTSVSVI